MDQLVRQRAELADTDGPALQVLQSPDGGILRIQGVHGQQVGARHDAQRHALLDGHQRRAEPHLHRDVAATRAQQLDRLGAIGDIGLDGVYAQLLQVSLAPHDLDGHQFVRTADIDDAHLGQRRAH